ncbi:hypothetical protein [Blastococcus sp. SYSU DS0617]
MRDHLPTLAVAAAITVAVGLLTAAGWPGFVIGAVLAASLWMMLFFGSFEGDQRGAVPPATYAGAAVVAVALGYVLFRLGDDNGAWWAPAFIIAGAIMAGASSRAGGAARGSGATDDRG